MKKNITRLLALLLMPLLLAACAGAENPAESGGSTPADAPAAEKNSGTQHAFPTEYHNTVNGVAFEMKVEVPEQAELAGLTKDTAVRQYPDLDRAVEAFAKGRTAAEERTEQQTDENGNAYTCYYGKYEDGGFLSIDNVFTYAGADDFEKIRSAFRADKMWDDRYNADQYLSGQEFPFATKEEALAEVKSMAAAAGYSLQETEDVCYSLDAETMAQQEIVYDKAGNVVTGKYVWDASDNSYYFFIKQLYNGLPVYFGRQPFLDDGEASMPVQAVYSEDGLTWLDVSYLYEFTKGTEPAVLLDFDAVVEAAASKYGDVLTDADYTARRATLYEMPVAQQSGKYEVKPVWQFEVVESGFDSELGENFENTLYTFIDAETGKEVIL